MKILQFITSLRTGGAERLVTDLSKGLSAAGDEVTVLLLDGTSTPLTDELEDAGITVASLARGEGAMRNPFLLFRLVKYLKNNRFDIIHSHNYTAQLLAAAASVFVDGTLVTTEHNTTNRRRKNFLFRPLDRWMYGRYGHVACVSEAVLIALKGYISEKKARNNVKIRLSVVANGINLHKFATSGIFPEGNFRVLMAGAFRAQKDQGTAIRAMALLGEGFELMLAGGSETAADRRCLSSCRQLAEEAGVTDRVHFLGKRTDVPELMEEASAIVLSTHFEGLSLSVLEGMASGKPFVASDVPGVREVVSGAALLFPEGDAEALAAILRRLRSDGSLWHEVAGKCVERASEYDINKTISKYRDIYRRQVDQ